jgi:hypothetical protein
MKAIFDVAVAAGPLGCAESAGDAFWDCALRSKAVNIAAPASAMSVAPAP